MQKNKGFNPTQEALDHYFPPSELGISIAEYLRIGSSRGFSYRYLVNLYMGTPQPSKVLKIINDFESAHAYLFIGAKIRISEEGDCDA